MAADPLVVRWESLGIVAGAFALAVWALSASGERRTAPQAGSTPKIILQVKRAGAPVETVEVGDGCLIGRGRECAIVFDDATVSKWHARLNIDGSGAIVEDLTSTNGTLVNGRRIEAARRLKRSDRIGIGANQIVVAAILMRPPERA